MKNGTEPAAFAAIDVGSNAMRLRLVGLAPDGSSKSLEWACSNMPTVGKTRRSGQVANRTGVGTRGKSSRPVKYMSPYPRGAIP